jgi:hypothetical protein
MAHAAIYLADKELPKEATVVGTRRDAEIAANGVIDVWMKKRFRKTYCKFPIFLHRNLNTSKRKPQAQRRPGPAELLPQLKLLDSRQGFRGDGVPLSQTQQDTLTPGGQSPMCWSSPKTRI